jgi:hypothetical protein
VQPDLNALDTLTLGGQIPIVGIAIALIGGIFLSLGAQFQHRGVQRVEEKRQLEQHDTGEIPASTRGFRAILASQMRLFTTPWWLLGTILYVVAILCQLVSLGFAPLIVVQPLGVVGLVVSSIINSRISKVELTPVAIRAIVFCVVGIGVFVTSASLVTHDSHLQVGPQFLIVISILVIVVVLLGIAYLVFRRWFRAIFYVIAAGICFGFVATIAKVTINRFVAGTIDWLALLGLAAIILAGGLGSYFVQNAYSIGAPDLVIAGLTVVDPMVAVLLGIVVLGEAAGAPIWVFFLWIVSAGLAIFGVFQLARHHPQTVH